MRAYPIVLSIGAGMVIGSTFFGCGSSAEDAPAAPKRPDSGTSTDASVPDSGNVIPDTGSTPYDTGTVVTDSAPPSACPTYTKATVAEMRAGKPGCYELDSVVSLGVTPSTKSPRLFVQDASGGALSAIMGSCSSTSTAHPCLVASAVAGIADGHSVTVTGTFIKNKTLLIESFYIADVKDNGVATTIPPPATVALADIQRGAKSTSLWFQKVTLDIAAADPLKMYDWSPVEFTNTTATACAYQYGFGMLPSSVTGATPGAACSGTTAQPAGVSAPNTAEVLVGTDFYKGFTVSSDCRCAAKFSDKLPSTGSSVSGKISGILSFDVPYGGTTGYQFLSPTTVSDFPIAGTL